MEDTIDITLLKDKKTKMIRLVSREINRALLTLSPPINDKEDILRLKKYIPEPDQIKLRYEISRGARLSRKDQNRSPYREIGFTMQVGRNS